MCRDVKNIIFDTDLGDDCDDVMALDLLISAHRYQECVLTGITYSSICRASPECISVLLNFYGMKSIPVGRTSLSADQPNGKDYYATKVAGKFPSLVTSTYDNSEDAVRLLRKLIVENTHSTVVVTGYLTNISALLKSNPDDISPLTGYELVKNGVDEFAVMGGDFAHQTGVELRVRGVDENGDAVPIPEWNIFGDIPAAQYVFDTCPVPIVLSPYSVGFRMCTGLPLIQYGKGETPDSLSFLLRDFPQGRDSFDPTTVLYAVYGNKPWFYRSVPGKVTIDDSGVSYFSVIKGGNTRILGCAQPKTAIAKDINDKVMRIVRSGTKTMQRGELE